MHLPGAQVNKSVHPVTKLCTPSTGCTLNVEHCNIICCSHHLMRPKFRRTKSIIITLTVNLPFRSGHPSYVAIFSITTVWPHKRGGGGGTVYCMIKRNFYLTHAHIDALLH